MNLGVRDHTVQLCLLAPLLPICLPVEQLHTHDAARSARMCTKHPFILSNRQGPGQCLLQWVQHLPRCSDIAQPLL